MDSHALKLNLPPVEALAQLDLGGQSQGAISKLPIEMLRAILGRVPAHHLIRLRLVNKKLVIEDILRDKKGLIIMQRSSYKDTLLEMSKQFNGHVKWNINFVFLRVTFNPRTGFHISGKLCALLAKLFPHIEQFFINGDFGYSSPEFGSMLRQWSSTLSTLSLRLGFCIDLWTPINDLINLKKLDMFNFKMAAQLTSIFARLEHLSGCTIEEFRQMGSPNLADGITSLSLFGPSVTLNELIDLNRYYGPFVSSLKRLTLYSFNYNILPFICQHVASLRMLRFDSFCALTTDTIEHLSRLTHLTELRIELIRIDMASLDVANLVSLYNIRTFSLMNFKFVTGQQHHRTLPPNVHRICRILLTISFNVENLTVKSRDYPLLENVLEPYVNLFVNLRSHDFSFTDPIDRLVD